MYMKEQHRGRRQHTFQYTNLITKNTKSFSACCVQHENQIEKSLNC